jgi:maltooligosyltrehalose synthase
MTKETAIKLFNQRKIRTHWDVEHEKWYFSIVDVIQALTDQPAFQTARKYWNKLKERLSAEGNQTVTNCHQL